MSAASITAKTLLSATALAWAVGVQAQSGMSGSTSLGLQTVARQGNVLPSSITGAPDDAWVPVMVLSDDQQGKQPVLLGLAQVKDIEDGYPYKVGLYRLVGDVKTSGALTTHISAGTLTLKPVCSSGDSPRCEPLIGLVGAAHSQSSIGLDAAYQLGPVQLSAGVFRADRAYTQLLNPYLPFPSAPTLTLLNGSGKQLGVNFGGALQSELGTFGLGIALSQTPLSPALPVLGSKNLLNEGRLNFNWIAGSFGTQVSTRVMEVGGNEVWGGLDLGLSWRTPWRGKLSFGAKNLVVSGKPPSYLDPDRAADIVDQDRVPYVRYEQDL